VHESSVLLVGEILLIVMSGIFLTLSFGEQIFECRSVWKG
jgi:hypothetical protein